MPARAPCLVLFAFLLASPVAADETQQLIQAINQYRGEVNGCADAPATALPPLRADARLVSPDEDWRQTLARNAYPLQRAEAIRLSGPIDAGAAMKALRESFCRVLLDPQYVDIGVSQVQQDWRIVLARPQQQAQLGDWQQEGRRLLELINAARGQARMCGKQAQPATEPLSWNAALASAAEAHSRAMAGGNFFSHRDKDGRIPGDRAELAGYRASLVGENLAAAQVSAQQVLDGWLASPEHCANLMNPQFRELGAAYARDDNSDAGIYWTAVFGVP
jgi:uncharacterized protein YkwD